MSETTERRPRWRVHPWPAILVEKARPRSVPPLRPSTLLSSTESQKKNPGFSSTSSMLHLGSAVFWTSSTSITLQQQQTSAVASDCSADKQGRETTHRFIAGSFIVGDRYSHLVRGGEPSSKATSTPSLPEYGAHACGDPTAYTSPISRALWPPPLTPQQSEPLRLHQ